LFEPFSFYPFVSCTNLSFFGNSDASPVETFVLFCADKSGSCLSFERGVGVSRLSHLWGSYKSLNHRVASGSVATVSSVIYTYKCSAKTV